MDNQCIIVLLITFSIPVLDCGNPPSTTNGMVDFTTTTFGSVANYTCDEGFMLDTGGENFVRTCTDSSGSGVWSMTTPTCASKSVKM